MHAHDTAPTDPADLVLERLPSGDLAWLRAELDAAIADADRLGLDMTRLLARPAGHTADCVCSACGHCPECCDGARGPAGTYCQTCHRTQRPADDEPRYSITQAGRDYLARESAMEALLGHPWPTVAEVCAEAEGGGMIPHADLPTTDGVYVLHLSEPLAHAHGYTGWAADIARRLAEHLDVEACRRAGFHVASHRGSPLACAAVRAGRSVQASTGLPALSASRCFAICMARCTTSPPSPPTLSHQATRRLPRAMGQGQAHTDLGLAVPNRTVVGGDRRIGRPYQRRCRSLGRHSTWLVRLLR